MYITNPSTRFYSFVWPFFLGLWGLFFSIQTTYANTHALKEKLSSSIQYDVRAGVHVTSRQVDLHMLVHLPVTMRSPVLWLYADRHREVPASFDEFEAERIYTYGINSGGYESLTIQVRGCPQQRVSALPSNTPTTPPNRLRDAASIQRAQHGRDQVIDICAQAIYPLQLEVYATLKLPARYGTLGVARGTMTLGDPWYPLVLDSANATIPPLANHTIRIVSKDARSVASGEGVYQLTPQSNSIAFEQHQVTHAPLVLFSTTKSIATERYAGIDISFVTDSPALEIRSVFQPTTATEQRDFWDIDAAGFIRGTLHDCISLLRRAGFQSSASNAPRVRGLASKIIVVEIPERQRLAVELPGMLAVSDHAFRIFPTERVRRFHALPIARRTFSSLMQPHIRASSYAYDSPWASDADGEFLSELLTFSSTSQKRDDVYDLIGFAGFHPLVDQLLYAPRVAFGAEIFGLIEEPDPDRHGADRARNQTPLGRFILNKLRDRLGSKAFAQAARKHMFHGIRWREAAAQVSDHNLDYFWAQWLSKHRSLGYSIVNTTHEKVTQGTRTTVTIARHGDTWIREPVVVEVEDKEGNRVRAIWDSSGAQGHVSIVTKAAFASARIDPDGRLTQDTNASSNSGHPRFDDETSHQWRPPIFSNAGISYAATQNRLEFDIDFALRRRFDIEQGYTFALSREARGYSSAVRHVRSFGAMRDFNSRFGNSSFGVGFNYAPEGFGLTKTPITTFSLLSSIGYETTLQIADPLSGYGGSVSANINLAKAGTDAYTPSLRINSRGHLLLWHHVRSSTVLIAGAGLTLGQAPETQLFGLADRQLLRAFEPDELLGSSRVYTILEQRFKPFSGLFLNALHTSWVKALEVVPFAAVGAVSGRANPWDLSHGKVAGEVGLGLRFLHEYAGVQPGVVALDAAVPFGRKDTCAQQNDQGQCVRRRQSFGIWFTFEQTF